MAERRMFTKKVTDDEHFFQLSASAQALYLHLSMSADDDGFSSQVSVSMFKAHASIQDLEALLEKRYIYQFENGVIVIKHWRMANALRKDRYTPTTFQEELARLDVKENGSYTWLPSGCHLVAKCLPQDRLGKDRLDKDSITPLTPLEKPKSDEIEIPFSGQLKEAFDDWIAYKKERRENYQPRGLKMLIAQIKNNADKYGEDAVIGVISDSMASGYKGITFDRLNKMTPKPQPKQYTTKGSFFDE